MKLTINRKESRRLEERAVFLAEKHDCKVSATDVLNFILSVAPIESVELPDVVKKKLFFITLDSDTSAGSNSEVK